MNFLSIFLIFFTSKGCYSQIIYSVEGEQVHFNFSYPCNSSEVTVQFANGAPFYRSTSSLQEEWVETNIDNLMVKEFRLESHCIINVWLNPVKKIHRGTYLRFSYSDDGSPPEIERIGLRVALPPGKASCAPTNMTKFTNNTHGLWVSLTCTASLGSVAGYIKCFQNGVSVPANTPPTENDQIFQQTFLVMSTHPVHCCSSTIDQTKSMCECKDTVWNPHKEEVIDHCQDTLTTSQTITDVTLISTPISSSTVHTTNTSKDENLLYVLLYIFGSSVCFVFLFVLGVVSVRLRGFSRFKTCRKGHQDAEMEANSTSTPLTESEPQNTNNHSKQASHHPVVLKMKRLETAEK